MSELRAPTSRFTGLIGGLATLLVCAALAPSAALGADRVYWNDQSDDDIAFANLDGSGGGDLSTGSAHDDGPSGLAIDSAAGRIYWANSGGSDTISFANLDGSGGGDLNTDGATVDQPLAVAIDPEARRIYWGNTGAAPTISFAKLDGSGGGDLDVGAAPIGFPFALAIDPAAGRIYWGDGLTGTISFAKLDETGGGELDTDGVIDGPRGVAIDAAAGRIHWINAGGDLSIWSAKLDGTDDVRLASAGATVAAPQGLAIDPAAERIYWGEEGGVTLASARLDGSGGTNLVTSTIGSSSGYPALLMTPEPVVPPSITGGTDEEPLLTCTEGEWAPDLAGSFLYQAPQSLSFQWSRDGADIAGATEITLPPDTTGGTYRCRVTAENAAGAGSQVSAPQNVPPVGAPPAGPGPGSPPVGPAPLAAFGADVRVTLVASRIPARGPVVLRIANANAFAVGVTLSGRTTKRLANGRRVKVASRTVTLAANTRQTIELQLPQRLQRRLIRKRSLSLVLKAVVTDPAGNGRTIERTVTPKRRIKQRSKG